MADPIPVQTKATANATPSPAAIRSKAPSSARRPSTKSNPLSKLSSATTSYATSTSANRTVLLTVGGAVTVVLFARISGTPGTKPLTDPGALIKINVGAGATLIALMLIAEAAPEVATHLGWLILVGALLTYGVDFAKALSKGTLKPGIPLTPLAGKGPTI